MADYSNMVRLDGSIRYQIGVKDVFRDSTKVYGLKPLRNNGQACEAVEIDGGGQGGTSDYEELENLPKINHVEIKGDLTAEELDLASQNDLQAIDKALNNKADKTELPVIATNNNIGLVKPDGTTIIIDETGKIVATGTDANFIPAGTVVTVETDGSGQYTSLSEAINYLTGKWSNGIVTIQLGEGEFESTTIDMDSFNCPNLIIKGSTIDGTILGQTFIFGYNSNLITIDTLTISVDPILALRVTADARVTIRNCALKGTKGTGGTLITCSEGGRIRVYNCTFSFTTKGGTAIYVASGLPTAFVQGCTFTNVNTAMIASEGGRLYSYPTPAHTYVNVSTNMSPSSSASGSCYGHS